MKTKIAKDSKLATIRDELRADARRVAQMGESEHAWFENAKALMGLVDDMLRGSVCVCGAATWTSVRAGTKCNVCGGIYTPEAFSINKP